MELMNRLGIVSLFSKELIEETFVIRKPGCPDSALDQYVGLLDRNGISIVGKFKEHFNQAIYEAIFGAVSTEYTSLMTSGPLDIYRVRGNNAIFRCRWLKRHIRSLHRKSDKATDNWLHSTDSPLELAALAEYLKLLDLQFCIDMHVNYGSAGFSDGLPHAWRNIHCVGLVVNQETAQEAIQWATALRDERKTETSFAIGINVSDLGLTVFPHPYDYERFDGSRFSSAEVIREFITNDAITIASPRQEYRTGHGDEDVREEIHRFSREFPLSNAVMYSSPIQSPRSERALERFAHLSALRMAAGSFGGVGQIPISLSADKFMDLAKLWKIY